MGLSVNLPGVTQPPPPPVVGPSPADVALWTPTLRAWARARHVGANAVAARAVLAWATAKGLT